MLKIRHARLVNAERSRKNALIPLSELAEYRFAELLLQTRNRIVAVVTHSQSCKVHCAPSQSSPRTYHRSVISTSSGK